MKKMNLNVTFARMLAIFVLTGALFVSGCNNDKDSKVKSKSETSKDKDKESDNEDSDEMDMDKVVKDVCNCIDEMEDDLSSDAKKIFLKAAKSDNFQQSLQEQLQDMDQDEQMAIAKEFESFENSDAEACFKKLEKKYPEMETASKKKQNELIEKVEEDCSEFAAAMLKMGKKMTDNSDDE